MLEVVSRWSVVFRKLIAKLLDSVSHELMGKDSWKSFVHDRKKTSQKEIKEVWLDYVIGFN